MPPVCKIMDYGKFKYEDAKKRKEARKHQSTIEYKEVKFRPKTDDHDFDFKVKNIRRFLGEGNKARLVVVFRGREIVHPETGQDMLKQVFAATQDIAMIEQAPLMEGRRMLMVIAPKGGVIKRAPDGVGAIGPGPGPMPTGPGAATANIAPAATAPVQAAAAAASLTPASAAVSAKPASK